LWVAGRLRLPFSDGKKGLVKDKKCKVNSIVITGLLR
jgi:hypothetical protein